MTSVGRSNGPTIMGGCFNMHVTVTLDDGSKAFMVQKQRGALLRCCINNGFVKVDDWVTVAYRRYSFDTPPHRVDYFKLSHIFFAE